MSRSVVYILLGSNLGDRERNLSIAQNKLELIPGLEIIATSGIYLSDATDMVGENPAFLNQVIKGDYEFLPHELLDGLEKIEKALGRTGKGEKTNRPIDLDILLFGDQIIETKRLSIPHRELLKRPFVMVPLLEIDPEVKAIVSSGYSRDPIMADFRKYGFKSVICKPYKIRELSEVLHRTITGTVFG